MPDPAPKLPFRRLIVMPWRWSRWALCVVIVFAPIAYFLSCAPAYYLLYRSLGPLVSTGSMDHKPGDAVNSTKRRFTPAVRCVNAVYAPVRTSMSIPLLREIYRWEFQLLIDSFGDPIALRF